MKPSVEFVDRAGHQSLKVMAYERHDFPFVWHVHPELELTLIVRGRGQRYVGDSMEPFDVDDLVLLGGDLPHTWHATSDRPDGCASIVTFFTHAAVPDQPEMRHVHRLVERATQGLAFNRRIARELRGDMHALAWQRDSRRLLTFWRILDRLGRVRTPRTLSTHTFTRPHTPSERKQIDRVCRWVADHVEEDIRQADAAALIHRSPSAFARFFKRMMGQTFVNYLVRLRVGRACRLLIETDLPITDIALQAGFNNLSYFNRCFRRHRDCSPRAYRATFRPTP